VFADPVSIGRDPFASLASAAPDDVDDVDDADDADEVDDAPVAAAAPALEIERGTPPPPGSMAPPSLGNDASDSSRAAIFDDEPAGLAAPPAAPRASRTASPFVERTLALAEPAEVTRREVAVQAPIASGSEIEIPIVVPAGETREIVLRITIRPAA
jgi:hypothetical protein